MKRFAALMMFAAWLLYGAMPAVSMPGGTMPHAAMPGMTAASEAAMPDHSQHHDMRRMADAAEVSSTPHQHGNTQKPCPHSSGKGCIAPFCAACLVLLPDLALADTGRFIHPNPEADDAPSLILSAIRPPVPPPRA